MVQHGDGGDVRAITNGVLRKNMAWGASPKLRSSYGHIIPRQGLSSVSTK